MQLLSFQESHCIRSASLDGTLLAAALEILWRANCYASDASVDAWDFAVEIEELRRAQITNSELRWLLVRGYARHAAETAATDGRRQFRQVVATSLCEASCFVISEEGLSLFEAWRVPSTKCEAPSLATLPLRLSGESTGVVSVLTAEKGPFWDAKRRELWVEGRVVKQFHCPAPSQQLVLEAFQVAHWPAHIMDPLPLQAAQCPKRRLHDAIKRLNRNHAHEAIRFSGDGSGQGVLWERLGCDSFSPPAVKNSFPAATPACPIKEDRAFAEVACFPERLACSYSQAAPGQPQCAPSSAPDRP